MDDLESSTKSVILSKILDQVIGSVEEVKTRRKMQILSDYIGPPVKTSLKQFSGGSKGEGLSMKGSDNDMMFIDNSIVVKYPGEYQNIPLPSPVNAILYMRDSDCRPGYTYLELAYHKYEDCIPPLWTSIVKISDSRYISSERFRFAAVNRSKAEGVNYKPYGPCVNAGNEDFKLDLDMAVALHAICWPNEASEWLRRVRMFGWPSQALIQKIVEDGFHVVPVGDKTSHDAHLQWRISFATAERSLIHSLSHIQFKVYGLLKYFLKQIKDRLVTELGDGDILCSYFMKTIIFYAVERTPQSFWREKNTFDCFQLCLGLLIDWVKVGYCPNYFFTKNNMFAKRVHGVNRIKLQRLLTDLYQMNWACLSVGKYFEPPLGEILEQAAKLVKGGIPPSQLTPISEWDTDTHLFKQCFVLQGPNVICPEPLKLLIMACSDADEFAAYSVMAFMLSKSATSMFEDIIYYEGNKEKYNILKKCKHFLIPKASMCASPGLLNLATFFYRTGNYTKSLEICGKVISVSKIYIGKGSTYKNKDRYEGLYCGKELTLLQKLKEAFSLDFEFRKGCMEFCLPQLCREVSVYLEAVRIPPLPYALFLSFLCYSDTGDAKKCEKILPHLKGIAKFDEEQRQKIHWTVHTLLGICCQTLGDMQGAMEAYMDSLRIQTKSNPVIERILALQGATPKTYTI